MDGEGAQRPWGTQGYSRVLELADGSAHVISDGDTRRTPVHAMPPIVTDGRRPSSALRRKHGRGRRSPRINAGEGQIQSRRGCGWGEPGPGADVGGVSPVPVPMWAG
jgi:hypothetical protein